jgi:hypothetical protein
MLEDLGVPSFKQMLEENSCNKGNLVVYGGNGCNPRVAGTCGNHKNQQPFWGWFHTCYASNISGKFGE